MMRALLIWLAVIVSSILIWVLLAAAAWHLY